MAATEYQFILAKDSVIAAAALAAVVSDEIESEIIVISLSARLRCSKGEIIFYTHHLRQYVEHLFPSEQQLKEVPLPSFSSISYQPAHSEFLFAIAA